MAMNLLAEVEDLADWIGEPITEEADVKRAGLCLRIASALVRYEAGRSWTGDGETVPDSAFMVTLYCASRVYENREAEKQSGVDDHQSSREVLEAGAYLTATEKRQLAKFNKPRHGGLGTVSTTRAECGVHDTWVPTDTPGVHIPWY